MLLLNSLCCGVPWLPSVSVTSSSAALLLPPLGRVVHQRLVSVSGRRVLKLQAAVLARVQDGVPAAALWVGAAHVGVSFAAPQRRRSGVSCRRRVCTAGRTQPRGRDPGPAGREAGALRHPAGLPGLFGRQSVNGAVVEADPGAVGEALPADAADEGPLPRVDAGVNLQRPRLGETLPALQAAVGLLARVGPLVRPHARQVREAPAAEAAGVRPLARVDAPVDLERPRLAETLAAVAAAVRPGARVHVEVDAEVAVRVEGAAALGAQEA